MNIWLKVTVTTGGTPGPLLGDGTKTVATVLAPSTIGKELSIADQTGNFQSVINQTAANQKDFAVDGIQVFPLKSNTGNVFIGAKGSVQGDKMLQQPLSIAGTTVPPKFTGDARKTINLNDIEVDAVTSGEGWLCLIDLD